MPTANSQQPTANSQQPRRGFTLSELLISLAILGLIASFAIPKVLHSVEEQQKRALFKETIATMQSLLINGLREGSFNADGSNTFEYYRDRLQTTTVCSTVATTEGCWPPAGAAGEGNQPGFVLPNGVMVSGLDGISTANGFALDYNGTAGPNQLGQDELWMVMCYGTATACQAGYFYTDGPVTPGALGPYTGAGAASKALYDWVFAK